MTNVNSASVPANAQGVTVVGGNGALISGTPGHDALYGTGGNDTYYGGGGNDAFVISEASLQASSGSTDNIPASAVIYDFGGAGGWTATNNDFVALIGFGAGSTFTLEKSVAMADGTASQYYDLHDTTTNTDYTIFIHSLDSKALVLGDYNFYA